MAELKTFLFTDICGSVRLKGAMTGRDVSERDRAFIDTVLRPHREHIQRNLADRGGRVVSTAGDGHFLVFATTIDAALWAVDVQRIHRDDPIELPSGEQVEVRISIHVGVPQIDPSDATNFIGKNVDYAARLNDYATGGQILVSRSVMAILDDVDLDGVDLHLHGDYQLKGIKTVPVYELLYDGSKPRPLRERPKSGPEREWQSIHTMPVEGLSPTTPGGGVGLLSKLQRVGNYELEELLGSGGMGDVYRARHTQFDRTRAVKVIKPQFLGEGHEDIVRRFYNEIKAVGKLEHKNIVVAIDSSAPSDLVHYLVMEYIDGVGLDQLVAMHGPLSVPDACETIRQAARGLQYIHRNGMVHRDIKPSNLMLSVIDNDQVHSDSSVMEGAERQRGVVKILDLGLALLAQDGQDRLTRYENRAMGTGMYMSPEQWKTTSVDIRADIYSLGCSLYHLLAGHPPFADSELRPEKAHEKSAIPPIRATSLPRKLWDVIRKMMAKRPEDRYAEPDEVAAALLPFCEGHNLPALFHEFEDYDGDYESRTPTDPAASSRAETWRSRWSTGSTLLPTRRWLLGTGVPILMALGFAGGALWLLDKSREEALARAEADARQQLPATAKTAAHANLPKAISERFDLLTRSAADPQLQGIVARINATRRDDADKETEEDRQQRAEAVKDLEAWIKDFGFRNQDAVQADSLFVNDVQGYQVSRFPKSDSIGKNYRDRDYFHGKGRNLTDPAEIAAAKPISDPRVSAVYRSTTTNNLKVAFSVPILAEGSADDDAIGVLAMSLNVAQFQVLEEGFTGSAEIVLIDLRRDSADEDTAEASEGGLILHHPRQTTGKRARLADTWRDAIRATHPLEPGFRSEDHFLVGYEDPLAEPQGQKYWAAFEPVRFTYHNAATGEDQEMAPGWVVLAQKPIPE